VYIPGLIKSSMDMSQYPCDSLYSISCASFSRSPRDWARRLDESWWNRPEVEGAIGTEGGSKGSAGIVNDDAAVMRCRGSKRIEKATFGR